MKADRLFSQNDVEAFMHHERATALRLIADHVEKHEYPSDEIIKYMREIADEAEAQRMVVDLRDKL
jgi:hypothetical protein